MNGIGPGLPLIKGERFGTYDLITSFKEEVKQNLRNLLLTMPGERVMNPDFGVGLKRYLFEPKVNVTPKIKQRVMKQVGQYMPFVKVSNIVFDKGIPPEDADQSLVLSINIEYQVPSLNFNSDLTLYAEEIA